jgi:hypothetical protein
VEDKRSECKIVFRETQDKKHMEDLNVYGRILLKYILEIQGIKMEIKYNTVGFVLNIGKHLVYV